MLKAPIEFETTRLLMRRPRAIDAQAIFARYAGDPEATRFMAWPTHLTVNDTYAFVTFSDSEWARWPAGPYLIFSRADGRLLGSTGYAFERRDRAITGYILARDAWGLGYATESLQAMIELAPRLGLGRLSAAVHASHAPSARVLEKCGFTLEALLPRFMVFPNLGSRAPEDVRSYVLDVPAE
jgi:ribosomal-protein-alanine N-acetyltransferase